MSGAPQVSFTAPPPGGTNYYSFGNTGAANDLLKSFIGGGISVAGNSSTVVQDNIYKQFLKKYPGSTTPYEYLQFVSALSGKQVNYLESANQVLASLIKSYGTLPNGLSANYNVGSQYAGSGKGPSPTASSASPNIVINSGGNIGTTDVTAAFEQSAYAQVQNDLDQWGLADMLPLAQSMITDPSNHLDAGEVLSAIRQTPEYLAAFQGKPEGMNEISYLQNRQNIYDQLNGAGVHGLSPTQIGQMIGNGIYGSTLSDRLTRGYEVVTSAPQETRDLMSQWFGVNSGQLLTYFIDPATANNTWVKQTQAAVLGTEAQATGFDNLSKQQAMDLAALNMNDSSGNVNAAATTAAFKQAASLQPLERAQVGQRGQATVSQDQILSNSFAGYTSSSGSTLAGTEAQINLAEEAHKAGLSGGGGFEQTARGGVGVGRTSTEGTGK